ncbi:hypothetical protein H6F51_14330 [Cyanobacteria bacterium FACHB-DQ100]|nr:hypothetical protein [Cyanobacteria bacterium FACHB-DQ100]
MSITEHETTIAYDYAEKMVRIFTTRSGVVNQILKRSDNQAIVQDNGGSWSINLSMELCRNPSLLVKITGDSEVE